MIVLKREFNILFALVMVFVLMFSACGTPTQEVVEQEETTAEETLANEETDVEEPVATTEQAQEQSITGATVVVGLDQEPPTLDPHASPSTITYYITGSTGESLLFLTEDLEIKPWLAESWEVSSDARSYTFKLRDDVIFQDGTPFNAEAVKWNFDRIVDPNFTAGAPLGYLAGYTGSDVIDEFTIKVNFESSYSPFLTYAALPALAMVSPTATAEQGDKVNQTPVMSGPYKVVEFVAKDHITIERWDGYTRQAPWADHAGAPEVEKIEFKFIPEVAIRVGTIESGETQIASLIPSASIPRLESADNVTLIERPWIGSPIELIMNVTLPPTNDKLVRQAINFAIDKDAILNTLYKGTGTPAVGPYSAALLDDPSLHLYTYDPEKAGQLLDEAGWSTIGSDGIRTKDGNRLEMVTNAIDWGGGPQEINQLIQAQLLEVGIDFKIKAQARAPWYEDNYNCTTNGPVWSVWRQSDLDGLYQMFHSSLVGNNFNVACIKDDEIDQLLLDGRAETDAAKRREIYLTLAQKIMDEALVVPMIDEQVVWAISSDITGLKFNGITLPIFDLSYSD